MVWFVSALQANARNFIFTPITFLHDLFNDYICTTAVHRIVHVKSSGYADEFQLQSRRTGSKTRWSYLPYSRVYPLSGLHSSYDKILCYPKTCVDSSYTKIRSRSTNSIISSQHKMIYWNDTHRSSHSYTRNQCQPELRSIRSYSCCCAGIWLPFNITVQVLCSFALNWKEHKYTSFAATIGRAYTAKIKS